MSYKVTKEPMSTEQAKCGNCGATRLMYSRGSLTCTNCDTVIHAPKRRNKFNASKSTFMDIKYDSSFEATVAAELELLKKANAILDWERQYKVEMWAYRADGTKAFKKDHKIDFRVHNNDGSYTLLEAKGVETDDYKHRRQMLETLWLPEHQDHTYEVRKQNTFRRNK